MGLLGTWLGVPFDCFCRSRGTASCHGNTQVSTVVKNDKRWKTTILLFLRWNRRAKRKFSEILNIHVKTASTFQQLKRPLGAHSLRSMWWLWQELKERAQTGSSDRWQSNKEKGHVPSNIYLNLIVQESVAADDSCVGHTNQSARYGTMRSGKRCHPVSELDKIHWRWWSDGNETSPSTYSSTSRGL